MSKIVLIALTVFNSAHQGYRRAGFKLDKGNNGIEATEEQFLLLKGDPRLEVTEVEVDTGKTAPSKKAKAQGNVADDELGDGLGSNGLGSDDLDSNALDSVALDLSKAPEALAPFINAIHQLHQQAALTKKPNCDEISVEFAVDGEAAKPTVPSANTRDEAWTWYLTNVVQAAQ